MSNTHIRIASPYDECDYQVVEEKPGQSKTVAGYCFDRCAEADDHCMRLNSTLQFFGIPENELYYALEMGPNVPEPE